VNRKITRYLIVSAAVMTLASPSLFATASPAPLSSRANSSSSDLTRRMRQLDDQLDSVFADTFRDFGNPFRDSAFASSIDLREQKDKYVVRVYVPDSDTSKVSAKVEGNTLHVTTTGEQNQKDASQSERYEQMISLPGPVATGKMHIERKQNLVVVTLPKAAGATAAASPAASPGRIFPGNNFAGFDQAIVDRMQRMQARMDQMFADAFPGDKAGLTSGLNSLQFGSAVHVDDQKNQYVVHFNLPDKDLKNVSVKLENGQLRLTASETEKNQQKDVESFQSGNYEQVMTLPGPVQEKGMKVQRQNGTIVITVPKKA
jgi:HSP20 family molecular chaperone IbpA